MPELKGTPLPAGPGTRKLHAWPAAFLLGGLEGVTGMAYLAAVPADAESAVWLGFSTRRLALLGFLAALTLLSFLAAVISRRPAWRTGIQPRIDARTTIGRVLFFGLPPASLAAVLLPAILLSLYRTTGRFEYLSYQARLLPLLLWVGLFCLQSWAALLSTGGFNWPALRGWTGVLRPLAVLSGAAAVLASFTLLTRIGLDPDPIQTWGQPAVPLLEWQIWAAWGLSTLLLFSAGRGGSRVRTDILFALGVWLAAVLLWTSLPLHPSLYLPAPRPPNNEVYPFSDGAVYDQYAQSVLIGNGWKGGAVPPRPFYVTLLVLFHLVAGQDYSQVVLVQTLILALLPVALYFLGRELHSRPAGLLMASLAVLRECNAIHAMAFTTRASHSKLLFADLPTALVLAALAFLALRWLKAPQATRGQSLVVGGILGVALLFRSQSIVLLPVLILAARLRPGARWRGWLASMGFLILGLALAVLPWLVRNHEATGMWVFDDPYSQTRAMAARYSLQGGESRFQAAPGESITDFAPRANEEVISFLSANPLYVGRFILGHWINSGLTGLQILPVRSSLASWKELLVPLSPFWEHWSGQPTLPQLGLLLLNLGLVIAGMAVAWRGNGWAGLIPLGFFLAYNAGTALARYSGWRYQLPVDWVVYLYLALVLAELSRMAGRLLGMGANPADGGRDTSQGRTLNPSPAPGWGKIAGLAGVVLLAGALPVLAEQVFPKRYPLQAKTDLAAELASAPALSRAGIDPAALQQFLALPDAIVIKGRALYPRYYAAGEGEPGTAKVGYEVLPAPRTLFLITAEDEYGLVWVPSGSVPEFLPNTADVIVAGCRVEDHLEAALVVILTGPGGVLQADSGFPDRCPADPGSDPPAE